MTRKEREAAEALKKKEDYMKRHLAGETEAAKRELAQVGRGYLSLPLFVLRVIIIFDGG